MEKRKFTVVVYFGTVQIELLTPEINRRKTMAFLLVERHFIQRIKYTHKHTHGMYRRKYAYIRIYIINHIILYNGKRRRAP